jgi:hypothetical protein
MMRNEDWNHQPFNFMRAFFAVCFGWAAILHSQDFAPNSIADTYLSVIINGGTAPFAANGGYQFFTSEVGTNYVVLGNAGAGFKAGTFIYTKTGSNSGLLTFVDSQSGPGISVVLVFSSPTAGILTLTGLTGTQSGAFTATNYAGVSPPDLFLPSFTNGQFQTYLSGQEGFVYSIDFSSDLAVWSAWTNVMISDLTTNLNIGASRAAGFFRATGNSTAFAPGSLTNKTFNVTITGGVLPLPTSGVCQWMADTNDNGYQILGGPGTTNSSGTYTYTQTGPNSGLIAYADSLAGNVNEQLFFTSPESGFFDATNATGSEWGSFTMGDGAQEFLGNIKYVPDTARAGTLYFPADGSTPTLSVTNAAGWIWTLSFPADALITPRVITMTPFASVDSSEAVLPETTGVQLEPDGIQFSDGVILTATPPAALGSHASLMMAGDDGSAIFFVQTTNQVNSYSTTLFHFTSAGITDPTDQDLNNYVNSHLSQALAVYYEAINEVKALERPVVQPPEPPDYELKCDPGENSAADAQVDAYEKNLFAKEQDAIQRLLDATKNVVLLTENFTAEETAISVIREMWETAAFRKVNLLFSNYSGNPKKTVPVSRAALYVLTQDALLGGLESNGAAWRSQIASWEGRVKTYYFDKLRNGHDYSLVPVLSFVERQLPLFGASTDNDNFQTDLANAMTFKLTMDIALDGTSSAGTAHVEANGDVTLNADANSIFPLSGSGTINYQPSYDGPLTLVPGQSFTENARVDNFDACKNLTASIFLDRFGADIETYTYAGADVQAGGVLEETGDAFFTGYLGQDGSYTFPITLQNKNVQAVNQTFTKPGNGGGTLALKLVLTHTPK